MVMKKTNKKLQSYINFGVLLLIIIIGNTLSSVYYKRFDLTNEKRYTLSETSIKLAKSLKEKYYFKLYLDGDMSAKFKQLKLEIRDIAYEFREISGKNLEIEIIDPFKEVKGKEMNEILDVFAQKGIEPVRDMESENPDETKIKYLLPGAELMKDNRTVPINFFEYDVAQTPEENIQRAIDNIEYEIANGLRQVIANQRKNIAVIDGNGEMLDGRVEGFAAELSKYYNVSALNLNTSDPESGRPFIKSMEKDPANAGNILVNSLQRRLNLNELIMIIKPIKDYSPTELYLIDQYIMNGGKVMWLIDAVNMEIDSFRNYKEVLAVDYGLENITASLFTYGVGIDNTLLTDLKCNQIPIPAGKRIELVDFPYFPLFGATDMPHIINKNMGTIWCQFPGTLQAKIRTEVTAIPLLSSTPYTKVINIPASVDLENVYMQSRDPKFRETMNQGIKTAGMLLEGKFKSPFVYQKKYTEIPFKAEGASKMIVIADGDIIRNPVSSSGKFFPTGYDKISQYTFANKKFLLNCIDYLIDNNGLIEIRAKERTLRLLDPEKSKSEKAYWQWYSMILPIFSIIIFGLVNYFIRRKRYN
jgi:gliding-associated putative ABC transporter substrate-binding component GldG